MNEHPHTLNSFQKQYWVRLQPFFRYFFHIRYFCLTAIISIEDSQFCRIVSRKRGKKDTNNKKNLGFTRICAPTTIIIETESMMRGRKHRKIYRRYFIDLCRSSIGKNVKYWLKIKTQRRWTWWRDEKSFFFAWWGLTYLFIRRNINIIVYMYFDPGRKEFISYIWCDFSLFLLFSIYLCSTFSRGQIWSGVDESNIGWSRDEF